MEPWRYVDGHRWRVVSDDEHSTADDAPAVPPGPERERRPITERTRKISAKLIVSALPEEDDYTDGRCDHG